MNAVDAPHFPPARPWDRWTRDLVLSRLDRFRSVRIEVQDPFGCRVTGTGAETQNLVVRDPRLWTKIARGGLLSAFESYLQHGWDTRDLLGLLRAFVRELPVLDRMNGGLGRWSDLVRRLRLLTRRNSRTRARANISAHYDLSNDFFAAWLDETMTYSAGVWTREDMSLREASIEKLDRICRKLGLAAGQELLEIGTGWGSFAIHAAREYGVRVTTTTISREQAALARSRVTAAGLADRVQVLESDYRDLRGTYDRIASIEMIEAVGHEYLGAFLGTVSNRLREDGLALIQAITVPDARYERMRHSEDFIKRHIFPGSCLLSMRRTLDVLAETTDLALFGHEDITLDYARTLAAWRTTFQAVEERVHELGFDQRFRRLWDLYLAYCEAGFRERFLGSVQFVLAKPGFRERGHRAAWPMTSLLVQNR